MDIKVPQTKKITRTIWSSKIAYAIGLITSDGCLSKDGRHIDFTSKDIDLVKTFKKCLGIKNKIGTKRSSFTKVKKYYRVQFGDIKFYKWLTNIGLHPNKSKTIGTIKIPDEFFFDFLRGCFDGDGTIYAFWDPRWKSSYMFYLQFTSASPKHLQWLQKTIFELSGVSGRIKKSTRTQHLTYAKKNSCVLVEKMFYKKSVPHLKRKLDKIKKIFRIDNLERKAQMEKLGKLASLRC